MAFLEFESDEAPSWRQFGFLVLVVLMFHLLRVLTRFTFVLVVSIARGVIGARRASRARDEEPLMFRKSVNVGVWDDGREERRTGFLGVSWVVACRRALQRLYLWDARVPLGLLAGATDIASLVIYVISSIRQRITQGIGILTFVLGLGYLFFDAMDFMFEIDGRSSTRVLLSTEELFASVTIASMLATGMGAFSYLNFNYFRAWSLFRNISRIFFASRANPLSLDPNQVGAFRPFVIALSVNLLAVAFIAAASFFTVETLGRQTPSLNIYQDDGSPRWNVLTAAYFMMVTLTTVGYGDLLASNGLARLYLFIVLLTAVFYFGSKLSTIIAISRMQRLGDGNYNAVYSLQPHVVVTGQFSYAMTDTFLTTLYSDPGNSELRVVFLVDHLCFSLNEWHQLIDDPFRQRRVIFIRGTPLSAEDRARSKLQYASAVFVLSSRDTKNPSGVDAMNSLLISAIREAQPKIPILALHLTPSAAPSMEDAIFQTPNLNQNLYQVLEKRGIHCSAILRAELNDTTWLKRMTTRLAPQSFQLYFSRKNIEKLILRKLGIKAKGIDESTCESPATSGQGEVLCQRTFFMSLMAMNVYCPGAPTLLSNLVLELEPQVSSSDEPWKVEYKYGAAIDFYLWTLPHELAGITYAMLAKALFLHTGATILALFNDASGGGLRVAATSSIVEPGMQALVLAHPTVASSSREGIRNLRQEFSGFRKSIPTSSRTSSLSTTASPALRTIPKSGSMETLISRGNSLKSAVSNPKGSKEDLSSLRDHIIISCIDDSALEDVDVFLEKLTNIATTIGTGDSIDVVLLLPGGNESESTNILQRIKGGLNRNVIVRDGSPMSSEDVKALGLSRARSIVQFPQEPSPPVDDDDDGFAPIDVETADTKSIFGVLLVEGLQGLYSSAAMSFYLKDVRSLGFCPHPRSLFLRSRLGEPGRSREILRKAQHLLPKNVDIDDVDLPGVSRRDSESSMHREGDDAMKRSTSRSTSSFTKPSAQGEHSMEQSGLDSRFQDRANDLLQISVVDDAFHYFRMRYASGQVLVPLIGACLLARERQLPGIVEVIQGLIGYEHAMDPMLRLFSVPRSLAGTQFGELFRRVVELGGISIGLYRSGSAQVILRDQSADPGLIRRLMNTSLMGSSSNLAYSQTTNDSNGGQNNGAAPRNLLPYVFTCPPTDTILSSNDGVYIAARDFSGLIRFFMHSDQ